MNMYSRKYCTNVEFEQIAYIRNPSWGLPFCEQKFVHRQPFKRISVFWQNSNCLQATYSKYNIILIK